MFRLEKLEISGFKSFADRTSLVFGEGITGVVGPNGCGKSNIAEAISWVLGEQSPNNLRGGKMEDVIFNGTRDRKPTGMAEVLLTMVAIQDIAAQDQETADDDGESEYEDALTNAEHAADTASSLVDEFAPPESAADVQSQADPGEPVRDSSEASVESGPKPVEHKRARHFRKRRTIAISAGERVTVGRRLYRTGDSDYLMNGRPCLLREIQDLFAGTGLGGAHYAIIEQGRIGQILSSKPLDRRALIEEAAGITKFKSRKRAAELKLESAKQNLARLNDIITEVERQVNSLKRQAQKARRYRRLREEMRSLLKIIFAADYHRLNEAIERVAVELDEAGRNQGGLDVMLSERESEFRAASGQARVAEDNLSALRERAAAVELEADRARNRRAFEEQQIKELTSRIEELNRDQTALDERLALLEEEAERRTASLQSLEAEVSGEQADLLARETQYQDELARLRDVENEIEQTRQRLLTEVGITERLRNLGANLEDALRRLELRQTSLTAELEKASVRRDEASSECARVRGEVESDARVVGELNTQITERASDLNMFRDEAARLRSQLEEVRGRRDAAAHRLTSLIDLDAHHAYYSDAVQQVLSPEQAARINALGTLADFVEVEPQYERLIESLFARELQSVLVPTIDDALAGVDYIKSEGLGRGAFLVVGLHGGEGDDEYLVPEERQLPPADLSSTDAIVIQLHPDASAATGPRDAAAARKFDEEAATHASRFQLEVLRAIDLLGLRPEIKTVIHRAFPDKCAASIVPDMEAALQLSIENPSVIYVTYEGEQVSGGRLIVTGAKAGQKGTSLLGLKREIKQLREQTETIAVEEARVSEEFRAAEALLREFEAETSSLDWQLREHEKSAAARNSQLEGLARDLERATSHVRVVESEIEQSGAEREELEARIQQLATQLAAAEASRDGVQSSLEQAGAQFVELRTDVEELSQQLSAARASVAARAERLQAARAEKRRAEGEAEELRSRINRNRFELYDGHGRVDELSASLEAGAGSAARFETERTSLADLINAGGQELASARAR